ncbi:tagaturonate epimerase family protein [Lignipirellula cremea]|uniref:Tagaturonate/fructuronate epimerase n=1 Tax=Lignipirellula cremea TaxID=2528010 RepID=A0A518DV18_9BACT|nr:tagaturonate epimerase family protein [Lignipirellula cremea]QDU95692.1 hypothetical protein Pla8534_35090 [Lignipirellula cremea]
MKEAKPPEPLGLAPTFGFGDRLGLATTGHLEALRAHGGKILPIFAQQSMRELSRTQRKPSDVVDDAFAALSSAGYDGRWGADADHLKSQEDINATAGAGFVFFTLDPSEHVDPLADSCPPDQLEARYHDLQGDVNWTEEYVGRTIEVPEGPVIHFDRNTVLQAAIKYGRAIAHAIKLGAHLDRVMSKRSRAYEIELSLDETPTPTTLVEHFIIAEQCLAGRVKMVSLAPRFLGEFEPGVDFRGDVRQLAASLTDHAAIARYLGPYKLSLHSGSDKFTIYRKFAQATRGMFHVKTSGASYLEALRVAARCDRRLFRRIVEFSRQRFDKDRDTYNVSARLQKAPTPAAINDDAVLERQYLDQNDGRQILHVTFGSVLTETDLGRALRDVLVAHPDTHREVLAQRFGRHLKELCKGMA